ncbi:MAG: DUF6745 domain-containing protein [Candidatus Omnitrophota bacterium]
MKKRSEHENKWVELMLLSEDSDKKAAEAAVRRFYELCNQSPPELFIWMRSPVELGLGCYILHRCDSLIFSMLQECRVKDLDPYSHRIWELVGEKLQFRLPGRFQSQKVKDLWQAIWRQIDAQVAQNRRWDQFDRILNDFKYSGGISVWDRFENLMEQDRISCGTKKRLKEKSKIKLARLGRGEIKIAHVREEIAFETARVLKAVETMYIRPPLVATRHRFYLYDWYNDVFKLGYDEHMKVIMKLIENCYDWMVLKNACILIENPVRLKCNDESRLHSDGSMAIEFKDGFGLWRLNGVRVPEEIVMTPREQLPAKALLKEQNAEVRREIVQKLGIEKVCKDLNARCIDRWKNYELLLLSLGDRRKRPYLKMINPSMGTYHIEGVEPSCKTVKSALAWRNGMCEYKSPEVLT